ncbi:hypothetical protein [Lactococcus lactis]
MNKPIYETIKTYGSNSELSVTKRIVGHERVTRNGFSRKKKPISMIKALNVRDSINYRKKLWAIQERSNNHFPENTMLLSEAGGNDIGTVTVTTLETGEKRRI